MHKPMTPPTLFVCALTLRTAFVTVGCLVGLLMWDASGLDLIVMRGFGNEHGFALQNNWWLEEILHTRSRQLALVVLLALLAMVWWPVGWLRTLPRWRRVEIVVGIALSLLAVSTLKHFSLTSCPWDLQEFGGKARYVSHWNWDTRDDGPGHCFPAGHASSALAFIALCLPWLFSGGASMHRRGQLILVLVLLLGFLFGLTQTLRGAHYPSHNLWTAWICWTVALINLMGFGWLGKRVHPTRSCMVDR